MNRRVVVLWAVVLAALLFSAYLDFQFFPGELLSSPLLIPILVASYQGSVRHTAISSVVSIAALGILGYIGGARLSSIVLPEGRLIVGSALILLLVDQRQVSNDLYHESQKVRSALNTILEVLPTGVIVLDSEHHVSYFNSEVSRLSGRPINIGDDASKHLESLRYPDGRPLQSLDSLDLPYINASAEGRPYEEEFLVVQPGGQRIPVMLLVAPIRDKDGRLIGSASVIQNISTLKQLELLREEWVSAVAHDLRQPLTIIQGYTSILMQENELVTVTQRRRVEHILTAAKNLGGMITDLMDVSLIEAHRITLNRSTVNFVQFIQDAVERASTTLSNGEKNHLLRVVVAGSVPDLIVDTARIEQVLGNLISNAVKYGDPNTVITVGVSRIEDRVQIAVSNQGPGIPAEEISSLFTRFYRTRSARTGKKPGLGLGLYVSQGLVAAHGGCIWVESVPDSVTTFYFDLPISY